MTSYGDPSFAILLEEPAIAFFQFEHRSLLIPSAHGSS